MPSNTTLNTGSGGDVAVTKQRTHDGDTAKQQGVFISGVSGTEDSYTFTDVQAGGGTEANALRVTIANDSTGVVSIDDNGAAVTVDNGGTFAVQVDGAALTSLQTIDNYVFADDAAFTLTSSSVAVVGAIRDDALSTLTAVEGDVVPLRVSSTGALHVSVTEGGITGATHDSAAASEGVQVMGVGSSSAPTAVSTNGDAVRLWATTSGALNIADGGGNISIDDGGNIITVDGTVNAAQSGTWTVQPGNTANTTAWLVTGTGGTFPATQSGTWTVQPGNTANTTPWLVAGQAAHDLAISGNPVRIAGRALTSSYTAVASGDVADLITSTIGQLVTLPYSIPENTWSYAAASGGITNTTGVTAVAAAGAGLRRYITRCQVVNGHATVSTDVQIRDGAAGTVLWRGFAQAAGGGVTAVFDPPLRGTANTLVEVACGTTGSATYFNLQGYTAP